MLKSLKKYKIGICLMLCSSLCVCFGQLLWKLSAEYGLLVMLAGLFLYGIGALIMLYAYRFGKVSVLQPVLSLNYVISMFLAVFVLNETIKLINICGVILIILGVLLIAGGDE